MKKLLILRVKLLLDGLPFISEGYSRAKSILLGKFGKSTEIFQNSHPNKIHDFLKS